MKKSLASAVALTLLMACPAYAHTDNRVTTDISTALDKTVKSELVIESSQDFASLSGDYSFFLNLSNAEWSCDTNGEFEKGITYSCISNTEMAVTVNPSEFDASANDMKIPIEAKVQETGVASVTIDPSDSPVSSGTYVFAHSGYPAMDISIAKADKADAFNMTITDDYPYSTVNGRIFKLELENGFEFTGSCDASGTGKFSNRVEFSKYSSNIAYINLSAVSDASTGTMVLKNIGIAHTDKSTAGDIYMGISAINTSGYSGRIKLGTYEPANNTADTIKNYVLFEIGNSKYYVSSSGSYFAVDSSNVYVTPYIDENNRTMVPLRAVADSLGITGISWDDATKTVTLKNASDTVKIVVGESTMTVNSTSVSIDTSCVIKDSRTFLPLRAIASALGIDSSNIVWDSNAKTIKIYK